MSFTITASTSLTGNFTATDTSGSGEKFTFTTGNTPFTSTVLTTTTWIVTDANNIQYNIFPPLIVQGVDTTFTITEPCTSQDTDPLNTCVQFLNTTSNFAVITNISIGNITAFPQIYVTTGTQTALLPTGSLWELPGTLGRFTVSSSDTYNTHPIIIDNTILHTYVTHNKKYVTLNNIVYLAGGYLVSALLLGGVLFFRNKNRINILNTKTDLETEITALDQPSSPTNYFNVTIILLLICISIILFIVWYTVSQWKYATYGQCSAKKDFGLVWRWAEPTRSKTSKLICSIFGLCECVSDYLENTCIGVNAVDGSTAGEYVWDRTKVAQSISDNTCFCCNPHQCVDINHHICDNH